MNRSHSIFAFFLVTLVSVPLWAADSLSDLDIQTFQRQAEKFQEQTVANPFSGGASTADDLTLEDLTLSGVVRNKGEQYALISGYLVRLNDRIAGYRISQIDESRVVLKRFDVTFVLSMEGGI